MEKISATIEAQNEKYQIVILDGDLRVEIPLSEDNPNLVKAAFNKLIARIKEGVFEIELEGAGEDLFSQVAKEYIVQLNSEIKEVRREMVTHSLTTD